MKRKITGFALGAMLFALSFPVEAQQPAPNVPRIGFLTPNSASDPLTMLRLDVLRQGLRDLGYVEGKNITIEYRYAEEKFERLSELAEELVRLKIDLFVVGTTRAAHSVRKVTTTIPIVIATAGDPIGSGLVASLARPGGNVTGLTSISPELIGKRLELLREVVSKVSRFGYLIDADSTGAKTLFKDGQLAAKALGVQLQLIELKSPNPDFDGAFRLIMKERIGALITESTGLISFHRKRILELVGHHRIPTMSSEQEWPNAGGLMSYGANLVEPYRRVAIYVDKILKGAKPADLPVEQPTKFEFIINLKAAKQIGLTIPPNVLARADKVIR